MKKLLSTLLLAGMVAFYACGPSAEEKAAAEKQVADSTAAADAAFKAAEDAKMQAAADSVKNAEAATAVDSSAVKAEEKK